MTVGDSGLEPETLWPGMHELFALTTSVSICLGGLCTGDFLNFAGGSVSLPFGGNSCPNVGFCFYSMTDE